MAAVGGPAAAGAALAAVVLCATLPLSAVVGRARAAARRALERERLSYGGRGGSRGGGRLGSLAFPPPGLGGWRKGRFAVSSRSRKRAAFAGASSSSGLATPFLRGRDSPYAGSGSGSPADADADADAGSVPGAFLGRVYFSGANAFGDPWRLPPTPPPAVQPLLHAEEWARLVRACATGAPASWGEGGGRRGSCSPESSAARDAPPASRFPQTRGRAAKKKNFGGSSRARWRGFVDALLGALFAPGQTWWRARERRRVAACLHALLDVYDRRCLRSARARALQEGLAFGCSDDARVAWLDFFAQGDEEDAFRDLFFTEAIDEGREDRGERAKREKREKKEETRGRKDGALAEHLPLVVVFSGEGSFRAPWRWETAPETAAGEGLPAAALRRAVPPATLAVAAREVRAALRRCRRVFVPAAASAAAGGVRRRVERRRGRGGGGGASFALAGGDFFGSDSDTRAAAHPACYAHTGSTTSSDADTRRPAPTFSRSDAFLRVDGADARARVLETSVNVKLRAHGVALALAAFEPPEDDPFGGFQLGLLGLPAEVDEEEAFGHGDPSFSLGGAAREASETFENVSKTPKTRGRGVFEAARSESSPALPLSTPPPFDLSREIDEAG